jgi:hypothetical protein
MRIFDLTATCVWFAQASRNSIDTMKVFLPYSASWNINLTISDIYCVGSNADAVQLFRKILPGPRQLSVSIPGKESSVCTADTCIVGSGLNLCIDTVVVS